MRKNELIDWEGNDKLNSVTKMAIRSHQNEFTFDDFIREREERGDKENEAANETEESFDAEAEESDVGVPGWDR